MIQKIKSFPEKKSLLIGIILSSLSGIILILSMVYNLWLLILLVIIGFFDTFFIPNAADKRHTRLKNEKGHPSG